MAGYDVEGARKAGYSDEAIARDIADFNKIDYSAAIKGGHSNESIIKGLTVNKAKVEGANAPGAARGLISVLQGPTLGFADEILGGIGGAYDALTKGGGYLPNYRANRDYLRGAAEYEQRVEQQKLEQQHVARGKHRPAGGNTRATGRRKPVLGYRLPRHSPDRIHTHPHLARRPRNRCT